MKPSNVTLDILNKFVKPIYHLSDYDAVLDTVGEAEIVLLGEATHGTKEFYQSRVEITKQLIIKKNFTILTIEGDWPDVYHLQNYINNIGYYQSTADALKVFKRFPTWMWANEIIYDFVRWLKYYNYQLNPPEIPISMYGLDLYSLHASIDEVIHYLQQVDPSAAQIALENYNYLLKKEDHFHSLKNLSNLEIQNNTQEIVNSQLDNLLMNADKYIQSNKINEKISYFNAVQNARLIKNAESYYHAQLQGDSFAWNLRDKHMFETLLSIKNHYENLYKKPAKIIVWAHNSHIGNAKFTERAQQGEINIGQLTKEFFKEKAINIGYSTYSGTVTAASYWGGKTEYKSIKPALVNSYENLFHRLDIPNFFINFKKDKELSSIFPGDFLERAIGVIYRPETERFSHYFQANVAQQFDAIIHFDHTRALKPLFFRGSLPGDELPETYPSGI